MNRSDNDFDGDSHPLFEQRTSTPDDLLAYPRSSAISEHRKPWSRLRIFHWPFSVGSPSIDHRITTRLHSNASRLSRIMGPILFVAALACLIAGVVRWLN